MKIANFFFFVYTTSKLINREVTDKKKAQSHCKKELKLQHQQQKKAWESCSFNVTSSSCSPVNRLRVLRV
jgi:hypothetical protein